MLVRSPVAAVDQSSVQAVFPDSLFSDSLDDDSLRVRFSGPPGRVLSRLPDDSFKRFMPEEEVLVRRLAAVRVRASLPFDKPAVVNSCR